MSRSLYGWVKSRVHIRTQRVNKNIAECQNLCQGRSLNLIQSCKHAQDLVVEATGNYLRWRLVVC